MVSFGTDQDVLIRLPQGYSDKDGDALLALLETSFAGEVELRRIEFVGPQVGEELRDQGGLVICDSFGWLANPLAPQAWTLLQIGLGGYVVGRSAEKVGVPIVEALKGREK